MNGFSAADMSTAAANGHAEGYQAGYADAVKAVDASSPPEADTRTQIRNAFFKGVARTCDEVAPGISLSVAAQEAVAWNKTKPTVEGAYYVRGFAIGQGEALVQVRMHRFDGEPAPELVCNIHESTSNEDMDDWWPMVDLSDDFEWLGPLVAAPVAAAPVDLGAQALHRHLLHMLGAKNHIDAGRIIAELHAASMSTPAAPGIDLAPRPMATAPRDGSMLRLLVQFDDHATEDTEGPAWTIGACNDDNVHQDERVGWRFAGWCWDHDHFTEGKGTPVGWLPLIDASPKGGSDERARFEEWAKSRSYSVDSYGQQYVESVTRKIWSAWKAAMQATSTEVGGVSKIKPTHWMDDLGRIATDEFMRSDAAHSDYQACYTIPGVMRRGKFVPIEQEQPTSHGAGVSNG